MNRPELLVFDWDGTLADSEAVIVQSMQVAADEVGLPPCPGHHIREVIGLGLLEAVAQLYPGRTAAEQAGLADSYRQHYLAATVRPVPLFDAVRPTLESLVQAGYLLAVATGKSRAGLDRALRESALTRFFAASRCADETASKPGPLMLQEILGELDVAADNAVMIGDTVFDMHMAVAAGMPALAVATGVHDRERLLQSGALACLDHIGGIGEWLSRPQHADRRSINPTSEF